MQLIVKIMSLLQFSTWYFDIKMIDCFALGQEHVQICVSLSYFCVSFLTLFSRALCTALVPDISDWHSKVSYLRL